MKASSLRRLSPRPEDRLSRLTQHKIKRHIVRRSFERRTFFRILPPFALSFFQVSLFFFDIILYGFPPAKV